MNHELFIALRIISSNKEDNSINRGTRVILRIAILGICLGLAVMLIAISTVTGFQQEIRSKVVGFGSHIQISEFNFENPLNFRPISKKQSFVLDIKDLPQVRNVQSFALKEGIVKGNNDIHGVIAKGIDFDFDWRFFSQNIVAGKIFSIDSAQKSNSVVISQHLSRKLALKVNDELFVFFIKDGKSRPRKFTISGIYNTGMAQFDKSYILIDIKHIQKINGWKNDQVSGFEVILNKYEELFTMDQFLYKYIPPEFNTTSILQQYPEIFGWLGLQDMNVIVILALMILVCSSNMVAALLILILEKTNMIGILKALGAQNQSIRKIFLYMATYLIVWGMIWGNFLGLGLLFIQDNFEIIKLDQASYYIDHVPVSINMFHVVVLNIGTLILCVFILLFPSFIVTNISPTKAIKFN